MISSRPLIGQPSLTPQPPQSQPIKKMANRPFEKSRGKKRKKKKSIGATICIGQEILCLPYAGFLCVQDEVWFIWTYTMKISLQNQTKYIEDQIGIERAIPTQHKEKNISTAFALSLLIYKVLTISRSFFLLLTVFGF